MNYSKSSDNRLTAVIAVDSVEGVISRMLYEKGTTGDKVTVSVQHLLLPEFQGTGTCVITMMDTLQLFDVEVRQCFVLSIVVQAPVCVWQQAQLNLSHGGLGLHSVSTIPPLHILPPFCASGYCDGQNSHLSQVVDLFNKFISRLR